MNVPRLLRIVLPLLVLLSLLTAVFRREAPPEHPSEKQAPAARPRPAAREPVAARHRADEPARLLAERIPGVRVDFDNNLGTAQFVASTVSFLTKETGGGGAESARAVVARFLDEHAGLFGHGAEVLEPALTVRNYVTEHNGLRTMVWQQQHGGIRVFESTLQAHVTKGGALVNVGSRFLPRTAEAARAGMPDAAQVLMHPPVPARQAVCTAAAWLGDVLPEHRVTARSQPDGAAQKQAFEARPLLNEAGAQFVWLPLDAETMRLCWEVVTVSRRSGLMHRTLVDAATGEVMRRQSLTEAISPASYRVFTSDSATPFSPGHTTPLTTQPPEMPRQLMTLTALDTTASPNGWINESDNETRGNNVDAHLDLNGDNAADLPRPQGAPSRVFSPSLDLTQPPSANRGAAVVNLFYWNNVLHDRLYALGFTEAAGNFQMENFNRGGAGNDAVQADTQDGSGTNNANFSTPPDGAPGRMQMFVFDGPSPDRDSAFDSEIIIHEYVHGLSNRLVGGGVGMSALQSRGMGEGWSDFYALSFLSSPADDASGNYAMGAYSVHQIGGLTPANYYYGLRRYPYSTSLAKNPLTFKDIDPSQANAHFGVPRSPVVGNTADSVHNMGEVWCVTLWEARANLIARHGTAAGSDLMVRLVTDGMKLAPANPTFLQARDAILQAELVYSAGANRMDLWTAFAKRGMGSGAVAPANHTTAGVVENFNVPDVLAVTPAAPWTPVLTVGGAPAATGAWTVTNTGAAPQSWTVADDQPWLSVSPPGGTLAAGAAVTVTGALTAAASSLATGSYSGAITFTNISSTLAQSRGVTLAVQPVTTVLFEETWESGAPGGAWTITGTNDHRTRVTTFFQPHGGLQHLTMDAGGNGTFSRNEATLSLNLADRRNVRLSFWLRSFSDEADGPAPSPFTGGANFDGVAVSADDGTVWHEVQPLINLTGQWQQFTVDLDSALAARSLNYTANFKIRFNHYDNHAIATDGFALDDIRVYYTTNNRLTLGLTPRVTEGAAPATATLYAVPAPPVETVVSLSNNNAAELTAPVSVAIPPGAGSVTFPVSFTDDAVLDGTQSAALLAVASGYEPATATVLVDDNETTVLTLDVPLAVAEGVGDVTGFVRAGAPVAADVTVLLMSSDAAELIPPALVVIPAGQSAVSFRLTVVDDTFIDGLKSVTLNASVANWTADAVSLDVSDNESTALTLLLPALTREGDGPVTGTVRLSGTLPAALTVSLAADVAGQITFPASVTVAAGQTTATFSATAENDTLTDGTQAVTIIATAPGFTGATAVLSAADNDVHHFTLSSIGSPQIPNAPIPLTVTAQDVNGAIIPGFANNVNLLAAGTGGALTVTPAVLNPLPWSNGVWTGNVSVSAADTNIVLTADGGGGHTGASNPFEAVDGLLHHFTFSTVTPPQYRDTLFPLTVTARDFGGNVLTDFTGTTTLSARVTPAVRVLFWVGLTNSGDFGEYYYTREGLAAQFTDFTESITTVTDPGQLRAALAGHQVFIVPAQRNAVTMSALASAWAPVLQEFVQSGGAVIVCSYEKDEHLLLTQAGLITATKWGSIWPSYLTKPAETPLNAGVTNGFYGGNTTLYTGSSDVVSLMAGTYAVVLSRDTGAGRAVLMGVDFLGTNTQLNKVLANAVRLTLPAAEVELPLQPAGPVNFTAGVWTGSVRLPYTHPSVRLRAGHGSAYSSDSNRFAVTASLPPQSQVPQLTISVPAEIVEGAAAQSGTVTLSTPAAMDTVVTLASGAPAKLVVPASVIVPAGAISILFSISTADDGWHDGDKSTWIAATSSAGDPAVTTLMLRDNEPTALSMSLEPVIVESGVATAGIVTLDHASSAPFVITLTSSNPAQAAVPATVTIAPWQTRAGFAVTAVDDNAIDGDKTVTITAARPGSTSVSGSVTVQDNETTALSLTLPASLAEGANAGGTVTIPGTLPAPLTVDLSSSLSARLSVPAGVVIPAGATSAPFTLTGVQNSLAEESADVALSATTAGFTPAEGSVSLLENDAHHFAISVIPQLTASVPFAVTFTALTPGGVAPAGYAGVPQLSVSGGLPVTPPFTPAFSGGVWTGNVSINAVAAGITLTVADGPATGVSNVFSTVPGPLHHFSFAPVTPAPLAHAPFPLTVMARDANEHAVTSFAGAINLDMTPGFGQFATGTSSSIWPVYESFPRARVQAIYTPSDVAGARRIHSIALYFTGEITQPVNNWVIRLKHTPLTVFPAAAWDAANWTTVFNGIVPRAPAGWLTFTFSTPFDYNGNENLVVDLSHDSTPTGNSIYAGYTSTGSNRVVQGVTAGTTGPVPTQWSGAGDGSSIAYAGLSMNVPHMRFQTTQPALAPAVTGTFVSGAWSGPATISGTGTFLSITGTAGAVSGVSGQFDITGTASHFLDTAPASGFTATGVRGFVPGGSMTWTITNNGATAVTWSAAAGGSWITLTPPSGTLAAAAVAQVTATFNAASTLLPAGDNKGTVTFTNLTDGYGTTTRSVLLTLVGSPEISLPAGAAFHSAKPAGGTFTPASTVWAVSNIGQTTAAWSSTVSVPWLTLSPASGSIGSGFPSNVTVSINTPAAPALAGSYDGTAGFTNIGNGLGNTTRPHTLHLLPAAFTLSARPPFTGGTEQTLALPGPDYGTAYELQADISAAFQAPLVSNWIAGTAHTFTGLTDGHLYFHRARSRLNLAWQTWAQLRPALLATGTRAGTYPDTTAGGMALSYGSGNPIFGRIPNESFENGSATPASPAGTITNWTRQSSGPRLTAVRNTINADSSPLPTLSSRFLQLANSNSAIDGQAHTAGSSVSVSQAISFTGTSMLLFDARTTGGAETWSGAVKAEALIDGAPVWTRTTAGTWLNQAVDVAQYSGTSTLELRLEILNGGNLATHLALFDNLRITARTGYLSAGTLLSPLILADTNGAWGQLIYVRDVPFGTSLTVDVLGAGQQLLAAGVASNTDLRTFPQLNTHSTIHLRANLGSTNVTQTPLLRGWSVTSRKLLPGPELFSPWSNVVSSTQDASRPQCAITSVLTSAAAAYTLTGTASDPAGIASLTLNGQAVSTGDAFAHWSLPLTLAPGTNSFTIVATDNAVPPNVTTLPVTVIRSADADGDKLPDAWEIAHGLNPNDAAGIHGPHDDSDGDGLPNLLEFALNRDPRTHDAGLAPALVFAINPADSLTYLQMHYRRRTGTGFSFEPVASSDLLAWDAAAFEEISTVSAGDGLTETVTLRLLPATGSGAGHRFVRLQVAAP